MQVATLGSHEPPTPRYRAIRLELERQVRIDLVAGNRDGQRDQTHAAPCEKLVRLLPGENRPITIPIWHRSNIFPHL